MLTAFSDEMYSEMTYGRTETDTKRQRTTVEPWFTNASDHERFGLGTNFPNTKRLGRRAVSRVTNIQAVKIPFQTITFHFLTTFHLRRQLSSIQVR